MESSLRNRKQLLTSRNIPGIWVVGSGTSEPLINRRGYVNWMLFWTYFYLSFSCFKVAIQLLGIPTPRPPRQVCVPRRSSKSCRTWPRRAQKAGSLGLRMVRVCKGYSGIYLIPYQDIPGIKMYKVETWNHQTNYRWFIAALLYNINYVENNVENCYFTMIGTDCFAM